MWDKLKIAVYTDDTMENETPKTLPTQMYWSWITGFLNRPWYGPYVYFTVNAAHCDLERIRAIECDGVSQSVILNR